MGEMMMAWGWRDTWYTLVLLIATEPRGWMVQRVDLDDAESPQF